MSWRKQYEAARQRRIERLRVKASTNRMEDNGDVIQAMQQQQATFQQQAAQQQAAQQQLISPLTALLSGGLAGRAI